MTWNFSYYRKGKEILGLIRAEGELQKQGKSDEEIHQIEAAIRVIETICNDHPEHLVGVSLIGHEYKDGQVSGGSFSANIKYNNDGP